MNTTFLLMAEFGGADAPLREVASKYLGISGPEADRRANRQALPFPAYRAGSQKSPWMVRITDLAAFLDAERDRARADWEAVQGRAAS